MSVLTGNAPRALRGKVPQKTVHGRGHALTAPLSSEESPVSEALSENDLHHRPDEGLAVLSGRGHEREVLLERGHLLLQQGNDLEHLRKAERNHHHLQEKDRGPDPPKVGKDHLLRHRHGKGRVLDPLKREKDRLRPVGNGRGRQGNGPHLHQERSHDRGHRKGRDLAVQEKDLIVQGRDLVVQGRDLVVQGRDLVVQGRDLVVQGRDLAVQGRDLAVQGRVEIDQDHPNPSGEIPCTVRCFIAIG